MRGSLGLLLTAQVERLGLTPGALPADGPTGSAWSRAYVLGAACASLQQQAAAPVSDTECFEIAIAAFALTYGETDARAILSATIAAAEAHEPEVEDGLLQGASDLALVASGEDAAGLHFATRNVEELAG
ncbi:hypothetical protein M9979_06715 [Sphingomonas sp. RP10(2022)]|uniref:Uncharacterized protein n=1 Tax=Sphingomonas liriopis TaxID=2949094 RepID=A0A9X2HYS5_9SPHN|nr:hypothetical protein [Sphingomonas liriopis]